ncbi:MAG: HIT family protein [Candidatus Saccharimonadales bacterium]
MEDCLFCKIVKGEVSAVKLYETENTLAFMDVRPVADGHVLVIPKEHYEEFHQVEGAQYSNLMQQVQKVAKSIKKTYSPPRVGVIVHGFAVPHAHIHVFPNTGDGFTMHQQNDYPNQKLAENAQKIKQNL